MRGFIIKGGIKTSEELTPLFDQMERLYPSRKTRSKEWEEIHQKLVTIASRNEETASDRNVVVQLLSYITEFTDDVALDKLNRMSEKKIGLHHALWIGSAALLNERLKNYAQSLFWYELGKENNAQPEAFLRNSFEKFQGRVRPILSAKKSVFIGTCNGINYEYNGGLVCTDKDGTPVMPEIDLSPIIDIAAPRPSQSMATITNEALYEETEVHTIQDETPTLRLQSARKIPGRNESTEQIPLSPVSKARGIRHLDESQIEAMSPRSPGSRWRGSGGDVGQSTRRAVFKIQKEGDPKAEDEEPPLRSAFRKSSRFDDNKENNDDEELPIRSALSRKSRFDENKEENEDEELPIRSAMRKVSRFDDKEEIVPIKSSMRNVSRFDIDEDNDEEFPLKPSILKRPSEEAPDLPLRSAMRKKSRFDENEDSIPLRSALSRKSRFDKDKDNTESTIELPKRQMLFDMSEVDEPKTKGSIVLPKRNIVLPDLPRPFPEIDEGDGGEEPVSILRKPGAPAAGGRVSMRAEGGTRGGPKRQSTPTTKARPRLGGSFVLQGWELHAESELGRRALLCLSGDGEKFVVKPLPPGSCLEDFSPRRPEAFALPLAASNGQYLMRFVSPYTLERAVAVMHQKTRNDQALCLFLLLQLVRAVSSLEGGGASFDSGIDLSSFVVRYSREELGPFDDSPDGPWGETGLCLVGCDRIKAGDGEGRERRDIANLFYFISQRSELREKNPAPPKAWNKEIWSSFFDVVNNNGDLEAFENMLSAFLASGSMSNSVKSSFARLISSLMDQ